LELKTEKLLTGSVYSRHDGIPGFDQAIYSKSEIAFVGAGGLNGESGEGTTRKGIGAAHFLDGDPVEVSNLNRQYFGEKDVGKNKAIQLIRNLQKLGFMGTRLIASPLFFQEAIELGLEIKPDIIVCGVDNNPTRVFVSRYALERNIPVIFSAVSRDGNQGYVFVQVPAGPCFGCAFPDAINDHEYPCPGTPAIKDILKVVAGFVLYAIDTVILQRKRNWNYRMIQLAGFMDDDKRTLTLKPDCPLCSPIRSTGVTSHGLV